MKLDDHVGEPSILSDWLGRLGSFPGGGWLLVDRGLREISAQTECRPVLTGGRDLSDDEANELEGAIERAGLQWFLNEQQLEDIVENLRSQDPTASLEAAIAAVQFYWENDAFAVLPER